MGWPMKRDDSSLFAVAVARCAVTSDEEIELVFDV